MAAKPRRTANQRRSQATATKTDTAVGTATGAEPVSIATSPAPVSTAAAPAMASASGQWDFMVLAGRAIAAAGRLKTLNSPEVASLPNDADYNTVVGYMLGHSLSALEKKYDLTPA